jgi:SAM-dependent methyltransferase
MAPLFSHHNIKLDDGTWTAPEMPPIEENHVSISAKRVLQTVFPGERRNVRLADLGCLEGGYAVAFARMGFSVLGVEVRECNYAACCHVKERLGLPNLEFVRDDARNLGKYGPFDGVFCCGLLYHMDRPKLFLQTISDATSKLLYLQTHFATDRPNAESQLSALDTHEGLKGRWYTEFPDAKAFAQRENSRWASWDNSRSFWIRREDLLQTIQDVGFDTVLEQFDHLGKDMARELTEGCYRIQERSTFIGIKTGIRKK